MTMNDRPIDGEIRNIADLFYLDQFAFRAMWGLTADELARELNARRLIAGQGMRLYLPDMRRWVARKRLLPSAIRAKVEAVGGLDRVERFEVEQKQLCQLEIDSDFQGATMTMPDGAVLRDIYFRRTVRH